MTLRPMDRIPSLTLMMIGVLVFFAPPPLQRPSLTRYDVPAKRSFFFHLFPPKRRVFLLDG